jgi:hypothetical protein
MSTQHGFVTKSFSPKLERYTSLEDQDFLRYWKIPSTSIPAPLPDRSYKAAVWIGRRASRFEESPIIAAALPVEKRLEYYGEHWYIGLENFGWNMGEFGKTDSELLLAKTAIDAALHGPNTFYASMALLQKFISE